MAVSSKGGISAQLSSTEHGALLGKIEELQALLRQQRGAEQVEEVHPLDEDEEAKSDSFPNAISDEEEGIPEGRTTRVVAERVVRISLYFGF
ncbi:hypothetical protein CYMTET_44697 [Cymbomonas tetramitiformis]|uniref:Uncharacterized protein n=1 Tax=Cymbomonas tetramitiformis TaxID=36881 RepID=A0AAE0C1E0_9CHLO|nr:hypothetical protein CYMTET_44697 [Cymbomonas tetramitiformis]